MKRLELFEFEDFEWLPVFIREGITNLIVVFHKMMGTVEVLSELLLTARKKVAFDQIVDLGSGSGGPMIDVLHAIKKNESNYDFKLMLTDLYPNPDVVSSINQKQIPGVEYRTESTNAANLEQVPEGIKTMVGSFHHMAPPIAKQILQNAERTKQPILIYELAKNTIPTVLWWLLLPLSLVILFVMALVMTPFVRGLKLNHLVFTYLIPVIPIIYAWDGQASLMRTYTFDDVKNLIGATDVSSYKWEVADALKANGKKAGYYIFGYPK